MGELILLRLTDYIQVDKWPLGSSLVPDCLDNVFITPMKSEKETLPSGKMAEKYSIGVMIWDDLYFSIPGIPNIKFFAGSNTTAGIATLEVRTEPYSIAVSMDIGIFFESTLLKKLKDGTDEPDPANSGIALNLGTIKAFVDIDGNFGIDAGAAEISLPRCMIGDSGVIIEKASFRWLTPSTASAVTNAPEGFKGVYLESVEVSIPKAGIGKIGMQEAFIGNTGFNGTVYYNENISWNESAKSFLGGMSGSLFDIPFCISGISMEFKNNIPSGAAITGAVNLPYFEHPIMLEVGFDTAANISAKVAAVQTISGLTTPSTEDGMLVLEKEGLLRLSVNSIGFEKKKDDYAIAISGKIKPLVLEGCIPGVELKKLSIHSDGRVDVDGGWLDLSDQLTFEMSGFKAEITQIGFGSEGDGKKWFGISGSITVIQSVPFKGSVEGFKLIWDSNTGKVDFSLKGIGLEFEIEDVLSFKGRVALIEGEGKSGIMGALKVILYCLKGCGIDMQFMAGRNSLSPAYNFFYLAANLTLPVGIPLAQTGIAIYGFAGLFGYNVIPNKGLLPGKENESWYKNEDGSNGWYLREPIGVTDYTKWIDERDSFSLGAGLTIGTLSDGGYTFSGGVLLVLSIPGPVIMLEGKANFMRELSKLNEDPIFRVFAIFDGKAGTLLFNLQAKYIYPYPSGTVIKVSGLTELFLDFNNPDRWHLYLGREKEEQRLIADIFSLFTASSYMMVDSSSFRMGVSVSIKKSWKYNPARVELGAYFDGKLFIAYKPFQAEGSLMLGGYVKVSIWSFSVSLEASAGVTAKTPTPYQIKALVKVKVDAPWPIPDFEKELELEWKEEAEPPVPIVTASIGIEHGKSSDKWQLTRYPVYDNDKDGMIDEFAPNTNVSVPTNCPIVPLDSKPVITFAKHVNANGIGDNASLEQAYEDCGSHKFEYSLIKITLERQMEDGEWMAVPSDVMFSKWQDVIKDGRKINTKLMLWAKTSKEINRDNPIYNGKDSELIENTESELLTEFTQHRMDFEYYTADTGLIVDTELADITISGNAEIIDCPLEPNYEITKGVKLYSAKTSENTCAQYATKFADHIGESFVQIYSDGMLTYSTNDTNQHSVEKISDGGGIIFRKLSVSMPISDYIYALIYNKFRVEMIVYDKKGLVIDRIKRGETPEYAPSAKYHKSVFEMKLSKRAAKVEFISYEQVPAYLMEFRCIAYTAITAMPSVVKFIFSEPVGRVVLNTYGQGNLMLVSQDVNNIHHTLNITCKDCSPEPFRLELDFTDIYVLCVRGDGIISFIDFSTMDEIRTKEKQKWLNDELIKSINEKWDQHSAYIFEPNSVYRLGVSTKVKKDNVSHDLLEYAFFKTGMAPGIPVPSQILCEEDKNRYPAGGMLTNLGLYVSSTVPSDGGTAAYFAYDTGVAYNETYVDTMYITSGRRLEMKLYDNNSKPVMDADGNEIEYDNNWGDNPQLTLTTTEIEYLDVITDGKTERVDISNLKKTVCLNTKGAVLSPKTFYTAKLIAKDSAGSSDVVYSFNFTTSAYASFNHHISSFNNSMMKLSHNYELSFGGGLITGITSRLSKYCLNNKWDNINESQDFEIIFNTLGMIPRALPIKVEVSLIDLPEGNKGFYIESPEPINADRTEYTIKYSHMVNSGENKLFECADNNAKIIGISQIGSTGAGSMDIIFREAANLEGMKLYIDDYATGEQNPYICFISKSESLPTDLSAVVQVPNQSIYPGTVVRLNFGSIADTEEPGIEILKVINADTLPAAGSRLTLVDANGKKLHSYHVFDRSILNIKDYIIVRNNDCTRMFVFLPDGANKASDVNPGIYGMELTYNRNIGLDKPILKRNGSEKAETAYIDFQID